VRRDVAINYPRQPEEARETEERLRACTAKVRGMGVRDVLVGGDVSDQGEVAGMVSAAVRGLGGSTSWSTTRGSRSRGRRRSSRARTCGSGRQVTSVVVDRGGVEERRSADGGDRHRPPAPRGVRDRV
jgi:hypothetical protein